MSEYQFVEKPLLNQLASMGWKVIEQPAGIPTDPAKSLRTSFREVVIKNETISELAKLDGIIQEFNKVQYLNTDEVRLNE